MFIELEEEDLYAFPGKVKWLPEEVEPDGEVLPGFEMLEDEVGTKEEAERALERIKQLLREAYSNCGRSTCKR